MFQKGMTPTRWSGVSIALDPPKVRWVICELVLRRLVIASLPSHIFVDISKLAALSLLVTTQQAHGCARASTSQAA